MPEKLSTVQVIAILQERVSRIESDAAAVNAVLESMSKKCQAAVDRRADPSGPDPDTAAAEHKRARKPPPRGYKPVAVREDREPY